MRLWVLALLLALSAALYGPWRDNPLVFDDANVLQSTALLDYAQQPFSLTPRQFPYFTLGFENVVSGGNIRLSRYVALLLHGVNGFLLFLLAQQVLARMASAQRATWVALGLALVFVAHPVAVYAVGYLVQRTILFSTLFLLLSAWQFDRALAQVSWRRALLAGACFGASVLSKEHALTGLVAVLGLLWLRPSPLAARRRSVVLVFLATALPFALWVASLKLGFVGAAYEPDAQALISSAGFPDTGTALGNWALSASLQSLFFFRYLGAWYWPDPAQLSIDIRPDFSLLSQAPWVLLGPLAAAALAAGTGYLLCSRRVSPSWKLSAFGLFWAGSLFLIELSTVRFQEAVVLYRSYLWAPGLLLAAAPWLSRLPRFLLAGVLSAALAILLALSWGRLGVFSDGLLLWQEAARELPQPTSPGAVRIHYNLGAFHAKAGQLEQALHEYNWVIAQDPQAFQGYWGRSAVYQRQDRMALALEDLETVIRLKPDFGMAYLQLGGLLKRLGQRQQSEAAFLQAEKLGIPHIEFN